jgi:arylsulfatase
MEADRTETRNIADNNAEQVDRLAAAYKVWAKRAGAQPWPIPQTPQGERSGPCLCRITSRQTVFNL